MRVFKITEDVFKTEPLFVIGCTHEAMRALVKRRFRVDLETAPVEVVGQVFNLTGPPWRIVWVRSSRLPELVHELLHLVTSICQDKGVPIVAHHPNGTCGDETAAYLLEFFTAGVLGALR